MIYRQKIASHMLAVDQTLDKIRQHCLGQHINFLDILEQQLLDTCNEEQLAQILTDKLMTALAAVECTGRDNDNEMKRCQTWLYGIILFLLTECPDDDLVFYSIRRIVELSLDVRVYLLEKMGDSCESLKCEAEIPVPLESFDAAILHLLYTHDLGHIITARLDEAKEAIRL